MFRSGETKRLGTHDFRSLRHFRRARARLDVDFRERFEADAMRSQQLIFRARDVNEGALCVERENKETRP